MWSSFPSGSSAQGWCIFEPKSEPFSSRFAHFWLLSSLQVILCMIGVFGRNAEVFVHIARRENRLNFTPGDREATEHRHWTDNDPLAIDEQHRLVRE
jgi:hypothetical protein